MFQQNLRRRVGARLSSEHEAGFTLVELLVVMLILGILAAIAIPAFFNQKQKSNDAQAKATANAAQVAMETYSTDNNGSYTGATVAALNLIEPTLGGTIVYAATITGGGTGYSIAVTAPVTAHVFAVTRTATGTLTYTCTPTAKGGCPTSGNWGQ